jgi:hypothetical protein
MVMSCHGQGITGLKSWNPIRNVLHAKLAQHISAFPQLQMQYHIQSISIWNPVDRS